MESAKCRLLLSEKLQIDRCKNCQISSLGYRFIGRELELLHSASDCSNVEKSVGITKGGFFSESAIHFSNLQISKKNIPKNYPEIEI